MSRHTQAITDQPAAPQPRKRHGCLLSIAGAVGLLVVIIVIAAVAGGGGKGQSGAPSPAGSGSGGVAPAAGGTGPGLGSQVRDGKFAFVVTRVSHLHSVGDTSLGLGETAQGRFTVLHLKITNIGNVGQSIDDSSQYVFDARGRKFSADSTADIDANGNSGQVLLNNINPGNSVRAVMLFDLPKGDKAVRAELHDSAFSGGVTVSLTHH